MEPKIFTGEALRELNFKAGLIRKAEVVRKADSLKYSKMIGKHKASFAQLYRLPVEQLKPLVEELTKS
jgi:hypothetical protein